MVLEPKPGFILTTRPRSWKAEELGSCRESKFDRDSGHVTALNVGCPDGEVSVSVVGKTTSVLEGQLGALLGPSDPHNVSKPFHATAVEVGIS